jgi:MerR family copper efflux transcriptional regulator
MLTQDQFQRIGEVAKQSNISIKTIRYYEELGLLKTVGRTESGYRLFSSDVLIRLKFIKQAQRLGLSLSEIKEFLEIYNQNEQPCKHIQLKLKQKLEIIEQQIQQLQRLQQELKGLLLGWSNFSEQTEETICPILQKNLD